jgi:hypothetical protein
MRAPTFRHVLDIFLRFIPLPSDKTRGKSEREKVDPADSGFFDLSGIDKRIAMFMAMKKREQISFISLSVDARGIMTDLRHCLGKEGDDGFLFDEQTLDRCFKYRVFEKYPYSPPCDSRFHLLR